LNIPSIETSVSSYNYRKVNNKANTQPSFKGGLDAMVKFWQFVDDHGRAMQFTMEDMTGTNFPRSAKGIFAGYKYKKNDPVNYPTFWSRLNILGFFQEAIREFLTGPTMCVTPFLILSASKKFLGKTSDTHIENIKNLSYILNNTNLGENSNLKDDFIKNAIKDLITKSAGKEGATQENINTLINEFNKYINIEDKKESKKALQELQTTFEKIVKSSRQNYKDVDFLNVKYSLDKSNTGATKFKNYINYINAYIDDYLKYAQKNDIDIKNIDSIKSGINNFKNSWIGKRSFIIASMIFITGIAMFQIPKIYTKASGKVNPNASTIYNEAEKEKNGGKV